MKSGSKINDYQARFEDYRGKIFSLSSTQNTERSESVPQIKILPSSRQQNTGVSNGQAIPFMPIARYQNAE